MSALGQILDGLTTEVRNSENWLELVRDLGEPITVQSPMISFFKRWAENKDPYQGAGGRAGSFVGSGSSR